MEGRRADFFPKCSTHMSSATNSHNYLYESWTGAVQSVLMDHFSDRFHVVNRCRSSHPRITRLHISHRHLTLAQLAELIFVWRLHNLCCSRRLTARYITRPSCVPKNYVAKCPVSPPSHGLTKLLVFVSMWSTRGSWEQSSCGAAHLRGCHRRCSL